MGRHLSDRKEALAGAAMIVDVVHVAAAAAAAESGSEYDEELMVVKTSLMLSYCQNVEYWQPSQQERQMS